MTNRPLSVEVFKDAYSPEVSVDCALQGIEIVQSIARQVQVVRDTRSFKIGSANEDFINTDKRVRWPQFTADVNIVVTDRDLQARNEDPASSEAESSTGRILGRAWVPNKSIRRRVAIVQAGENKDPQLVAAHEIGHLIGLKDKGDTFDEYDHCIDEQCLMFPTAMRVDIVDAQEVVLPARWFRREKKVIKKQVTGDRAAAEEFCMECADQLGQNAYYLQLAKTGKVIPSVLLPHGVA